jgi:L,D-peptidoglycan transpeptidase YkuD (ErfK/YbiS/YcfS/YnhG family)
VIGLAACRGPSSVSPAPAVSRSPIPAAATHLLVVRSASWDATTARMARYERTKKGWAQAGTSIDVVLGHGGMGWGRGLHGDSAPAGMDGPVKREGDGRSPAGVFTIGGVYGYDAMPPQGTRVPYVQVTEPWRCVDDSASSRYNQVFDAAGATPDWSSAEVMLRDDVLHTRVVVVEHNTRPARPGSGSCIFLHVWPGPGSTTTGCTAMAIKDLEGVVTFLVDKTSVIVQLEDGAYMALAGSWGLPL